MVIGRISCLVKRRRCVQSGYVVREVTNSATQRTRALDRYVYDEEGVTEIERWWFRDVEVEVESESAQANRCREDSRGKS